MAQSSIEWTEMTWNPTTGCNKVSAGCKFCYAEVMTRRLKAMGVEKYQKGFKIAMHEQELDLPYTWKSSKVVFVNSMSDLFHEDIPPEFIKRVFRVMNDNPHHTFQVLTKRSERLVQCHTELNWTPNIWMGVSIEDDRVIHRLDDLKKSSALVKFLSCEPLIGPLNNLDLTGIHWVIVGGESGKRKIRPMMPDWVLDIKSQCRKYDVAFFFKQWGGTNKKKTGRLLKGRTYNEMPKRIVKRRQSIPAAGIAA